MRKTIHIIVSLLCILMTASAQTASPSPPPSRPASSPQTSQTTNDATPADGTPATQSPATGQESARPSTVSPVAARGPGESHSNLNSSLIPPEKRVPAHAPRFEQAPTIDGRLDDEVWKHAVVLKNFYQTQPGDNIAPSHPTEVLLGYNAKTLYIGFRAYDEPGKVRATVAKRDSVLDDDNVRIYLDTFNDQRKAYVLIFNPLGVQQDGVLTEGGSEDYSVDIVMDSKGVLTDKGYTVEAAIPFRSLRYGTGKGNLWGIQVIRHIKHLNDEQDSWMPIARDNSRFLGQEGYLTGFEGLSTERTLELIPSLTLSETGTRVRALPPRVSPTDPLVQDPGRFVNKPINFDPGLTAKFGITPNVTLDLALNPDFAQVEADQTVVFANQRFPIFFEEKRPFFLEGIDIFRTLLTPVHTRAIIDPDIAVKLTGKLGRNTFGLLLAVDNAPGNFSEEERTDPTLLPSIQKFLDKKAYIGVLRFKRDLGKENNLGIIATTYNFIEKHNDVGGINGRFRLDAQRTFQFEMLGTTSRRIFFDPDLGQDIYRTGNAFGYSYIYDNNGRHFGYNFSGEGRTRDYRADVGFTRRTNTNSEQLLVRYNSEPNGKNRIISWHVHDFIETSFDWQGRSQFFRNSNELKLNLQRQSFLGFGVQKGYERVFEEEFGQKRKPGRAGTFAGEDSERSAYRKAVYVYGGMNPSQKYSFNFEVDYNWGALDFDLGNGSRFPRVSPSALLARRAQASGLCDGQPSAPDFCQARQDPGPGNELTVDATFAYQPTQALRAELHYVKDKLRRLDTGLLAFDDNIFALRSTYQFTRFTFIRARVDYDTLNANVRGQLLFGWTPNPGTSLYVGYNDDLNRNGFNPFTGQLEPGFRRNGQTFFIKLSYLIRRSW